MNCEEPVDDYCNAWEILEIPKKIPIPPTGDDQFFINLEIETTLPPRDEDDMEMVEVECRDVFTFWAARPLTKQRISEMLSEARVPKHKQKFMVDRISGLADEVARDKDRRVLAMKVQISIVACLCYGESVED